jgi:hypothetical protein
MESPLPGTGRDDRRRGPSEVARRQHRPSPGAARRPLPARERRLFVASLGTAGSFLAAHSTDQTLPPGNVGATRWVAHSVRRVHWDRVRSCGADVRNGARATHRVAPTSPAYSRVRYANEHGTATGVSVVGAVHEPPPTTRHVASGPATGSPGSVGVPRMQRTRRDARRERAWYMRSCPPPCNCDVQTVTPSHQATSTPLPRPG